MKKLVYTLLRILFLTASLVSCGPEGGDYRFDNPKDPLYNSQPYTAFISISSVSQTFKETGIHRNPVTVSWAGSDNNDYLTGYYHKVDNSAWTWTEDSFITYTGLSTGCHVLCVKAKDSVGAVEESPCDVDDVVPSCEELRDPSLFENWTAFENWSTFEVDATPPSVSFTTPRHNSNDIPVNSSITATFSELMDRDSIVTISSFELRDGFDVISGTLDYDYSTLNFKPVSALVFSTAYTATVTTAATDEVGNPLPSQYPWTFTTGSAPDTIKPTVSSTFPVRDAEGVSKDSSINAIFSEPMLAATIDASSFTLSNITGDVSGMVFYSGLTATLIPFSSLSTDTSYTATITTAVTDLADPSNSMPADYSWSFTTGSEPDTTAPMVSSTSPKNGEADVPANAAITATFSEPVDSSTITTASFKLSDAGGDNVPGSVYYSGTTAAFTPHTALDYSSSYTARITTDVMDASGNPIISDYFWSFATGLEPDTDTTPPTVSSTTPKHASTAVAVNAAITAIFSEPMDAYTISTASFTLWDNDNATDVSGAVTYSGTTATFMPYTSLDSMTSHTATIASDVTDTAANNLPVAYSWSFETGAEPDTTPPVVMWTNPFDDATDIDIETAVTATFSEAVDLSTVTTNTFKLKDYNNNPVIGNVSLSGTSAMFTPYTSLFEGEYYTVTITTGVKDGAGNNLLEDYIWNFTTGILPDLVPPTVSSVIPFDNATSVPYDTSVIVTFSEPLDSSTINTDSFALYDEVALVYVDGNVYYDGDLTAIFTPLSSISYDTLHTVEIATDIKDVAGNSMLGNYSSSFTTSSAPDTERPYVVSTAPFDGETHVPVNDPRIFIVFNEPMDASTITGTNISVEDEYSNLVDGYVYFDGVLTALFKPWNDLNYETIYTLTVSTGVKDTAAIPNSMQPERSFNFTTGSLPIVIASSVSGGLLHSLAIRNDLTAWAWGYNTNGELGDGTTDSSISPVQTLDLTGVVASVAGDNHSMALLTDKTVWAWGDNGLGQLGIGVENDDAIYSTATTLPGFSNVVALAAGSFHSMALKSNGTVWTWGDNSSGQLGDGTFDDKASPVQVIDPGDASGYLQGVVAIAAGEYHSVAVKNDDTVMAWGWNNAGQLGNMTTANSFVPVSVVGLSDVTEVAAGGLHTSALKTDGTVWSWGWNGMGQLGNSTNTDSLTPVRATGLSGVNMISSGSLHSMALKDGMVSTWGRNSFGQLGNGTTTDSNAPVSVPGINGVTAIAGGYLHSLALKGSGTVWTWGDNSAGQLGYLTPLDIYGVPLPGLLGQEVQWP